MLLNVLSPGRDIAVAMRHLEYILPNLVNDNLITIEFQFQKNMTSVILFSCICVH